MKKLIGVISAIVLLGVALYGSADVIQINFVDNTIGASKLKSTSGTPSATTYFRGDNTWAVPPGSAAISWDNVAITGGTIDNVTLQGVTSTYYDPTSSIQDQIDGKQSATATIVDVSDGSLANPLVFADDVYLKFGTDNDFRAYYKAADATFVIALDNGSAMCTFSKTGGLACTGEITAQQYATDGVDGEFFIQVANSTAPTIPATDNAGIIWFDTSDNTVKVTNADGAIGTVTVSW